MIRIKSGIDKFILLGFYWSSQNLDASDEEVSFFIQTNIQIHNFIRLIQLLNVLNGIIEML